jgi:hypothetical protein
MSELRTEKVGSSRMRASTTSLRYCRRYVEWIFRFIESSSILTTSLNLDSSERYCLWFALCNGKSGSSMAVSMAVDESKASTLTL